LKRLVDDLEAELDEKIKVGKQSSKVYAKPAVSSTDEKNLDVDPY
jgi:hypothetical protein